MEWNDDLGQTRATSKGIHYWVYENKFKFDKKWRVYFKSFDETQWKNLPNWFENDYEAAETAEIYNSNVVEKEEA